MLNRRVYYCSSAAKDVHITTVCVYDAKKNLSNIAPVKLQRAHLPFPPSSFVALFGFFFFKFFYFRLPSGPLYGLYARITRGKITDGLITCWSCDSRTRGMRRRRLKGQRSVSPAHFDDQPARMPDRHAHICKSLQNFFTLSRQLNRSKRIYSTFLRDWTKEFCYENEWYTYILN